MFPELEGLNLHTKKADQVQPTKQLVQVAAAAQHSGKAVSWRNLELMSLNIWEENLKRQIAEVLEYLDKVYSCMGNQTSEQMCS